MLIIILQENKCDIQRDMMEVVSLETERYIAIDCY